MNRFCSSALAVFCSLCVLSQLAQHAIAQADTTFTYQGELTDAGAPASGTYAMDFSLWDASAGGNQIGPTLTIPAQMVASGLFTAELDFGAPAFDGTQRWLEIVVNGTTLSPRNPITRTPYAIQTRGIFVDANNRVGIGTTTPQHTIDIQDDEAILRLTTTNTSPTKVAQVQLQSPGTSIFSPFGSINFFDGSEALRATINSSASGPSAAQISMTVNPGALPTLRVLSSAVRITDALEITPSSTGIITSRIAVNGDDSFVQVDGGHFGIGTDSPLSKLHVVSDGGTAIEADGGLSSGIQAITDSTNPIPAIEGQAVSLSGNPIGVEGINRSTDGIGVRGFSSAATGPNIGVQGVSNSLSGFDFFAGGSGVNYGASSSRRWKHNISNIDDPLEKIAYLRGVYFDWDERHGGHHDIGMIAEEVGQVIPEIVQYEDNGIDAIGMDYSKLTPLLVEAVNAMQVEHKQMDAQMARKDAQIDQLTQRIEELEAMVEQLIAQQSRENR